MTLTLVYSHRYTERSAIYHLRSPDGAIVRTLLFGSSARARKYARDIGATFQPHNNSEKDTTA